MIKNNCRHAYKMLDKAECLWCEACVEELVKEIQKPVIVHPLPMVTGEDVFNFHNNLMTIQNDVVDGEDTVARELSYIRYWLKSKGMNVVQ